MKAKGFEIAYAHNISASLGRLYFSTNLKRVVGRTDRFGKVFRSLARSRVTSRAGYKLAAAYR